MTAQELSALISEPSTLSPEQLPELLHLAEAYPYCAPLSFLYLYGLAHTKDVRYTSELNRLAIRLPSRAQLYRLVERPETMEPRESVSTDKGEPEDAFALIDEFLSEAKEAGQDLPESLSYTPAEAGDYFSTPAGRETLEQAPAQEEASAPTLCVAPSEKPAPAPAPEPQEDELLTETLAKIYIQQGHYAKAHRIITTLSLNYPKKNRYFADQIRFLERLIENNKDI